MLGKNEISEYIITYLSSISRIKLLEISKEWAIDKRKNSLEKFQFLNDDNLIKWILKNLIIKDNQKEIYICPYGCHSIDLQDIQSPLNFEKNIRELEYCQLKKEMKKTKSLLKILESHEKLPQEFLFN